MNTIFRNFAISYILFVPLVHASAHDAPVPTQDQPAQLQQENGKQDQLQQKIEEQGKVIVAHEQENAQHIRAIETLKQKASELESTAQLNESKWKTAHQIFQNIAQEQMILLMQNHDLSVSAYRYKIAAYALAFTTVGLTLYSFWDKIQRTLNTIGTRIMACISYSKTRTRRKKIEEDFVTVDL